MKNLFLFYLLILLSLSPLWANEIDGSAIHITKEEKQWITEHPVIRVANESDWAPFDYVEYDQPKGLVIDYIHLVAKKAGLKVKLINGYTWAELVELFIQKKIDVMPVFYKTEERKSYTLFTRPYTRAKVGILTTTDSKISKKSELINFKVAMEKGYATIELVKERFPGIDVIEMDDNVSLIQSLATKKIDAILGDPLVYHYYAKEEQIHNIKTFDYINMTKEQQLNNSFHIGIRKDWVMLHQIIQKAMDSISSDEYSHIEKKWMSQMAKSGIQIETIGILSLGIVALFLFFIYRHYRLNQSRLAYQKGEARLQAILNSSPIPQALNDKAQNVTFLNEAFIKTFGYTISDIPTIYDWREKAYPDEKYRDWIIKQWQSHAENTINDSEDIKPILVEINCKNGDHRHVRVSLTSTSDSLDNELQIVTLYDVTEQKQIEEEKHKRHEQQIQNQKILLKTSKETFSSERDIFNKIITVDAQQLKVARVSIWFLNEDNTVLTCKALYTQSKISNNEVVLEANDYPHYFHALDTIGFISANDAQTNPLTNEFSSHYLIPLGITSMMDIPIRIQGKMIGIICHEHIGLKRKWTEEERDFAKSLSDLCTQFLLENERKKTEKTLQLSDRVFSDTHEGIIITNANILIVDVNPACCEITGYGRKDIIGKSPSILKSGKHSSQFYKDMWNSINQHGFWKGEIWNRTKEGEIYAELLTISTIWNEKNEIINYVGMFSDITQSKKQQEELTLMAHYDVLTGLPNRTLFIDRFHQAISHTKRSKTQLAICFLDLDKFKPVNDNYGHDIGDQLLIEVAKRITSCIREEDTVSRQGGDEFALLLNDIESYAQCKNTLERIHQSLTQPYLIDDLSLVISASSGCTLYPSDEGDIDTLVRHADQAMYQSKQLGRNQFHFFDAAHDKEIFHKHHLLTEIEQALLNNELTLYYQPKVNMVTGDVYGAEALIRWIHPEKGLIPPLDFLPLIDGTPLETQVGDWVINQALKQLDSWLQQGIVIEVSINIASYHLLSKNFTTVLEQALAKYPDIDSNYLQLEILESSALGDLQSINNVIKTCQSALGVNIALDDFGTGYSSLTHLRSLSANTIKIDQSFVRDMLDDSNDYSIIDGIIGLSETFGRKVIAEGVESTQHGLMLLLLGCELAQGYGISKPMPATEVPLWLINYRANPEWIQCAKKHYTAKESKLQLFHLISQQWKNKFIRNLQSSVESTKYWPVMNSTRCHCAYWIKREKQAQLFEENSLKQVEIAHENFHVIARTLQSQYQGGDIDIAREGLKDLEASFDKLSNVLEICR